MESIQMERGNEIIMMKILDNIQKIEAQKRLLETTLSEPRLVNSKILSSLKPKVGRKFNYEDLEKKKEEKLIALRKELLSIAIEERNRDLLSSRRKWSDEKSKIKSTHTVQKQKEVEKKLEQKSLTTANHLNTKMI